MKGRSLLLAIAWAMLVEAPALAQSILDAELSERVMRSVFQVVVRKPQTDPLSYAERLPQKLLPSSRQDDLYLSMGTAFALSDGRYITAGHVLGPERSTLLMDYALRDTGGNLYPIGRIVGYSYWRDYLVLEVPGLTAPGLPTGQVPAPNTPVFAVGNALGQGLVIREGVLTSLMAETWMGAWKWLEFSAPVSPGNSGGPLIDAQGNVLGIVVARSNDENRGYALPVSEIAADHKAYLDMRFGYTIPNITRSVATQAHTAIDLPLSPEILRDKLSGYVTKLERDSARRVVTERPEEVFPQSPKSATVLGEAPYLRFPSILVQQPDNTWKIGAPSDRRTATVGDDGRLSYGEYLGYVFLSLEIPTDVTVAALLADPKTLADLILEGYPLARSVPDGDIRITSLGEPIETSRYADAWGRSWMAALWGVPEGNTGILIVCTPVPNGVLCVYRRAAYGQIRTYEIDFRVMSDFMIFTYYGSLLDWKSFLTPSDWVPSLFRDWRLEYEAEDYISLETPRFSWYGQAKDIAVSDVGMIAAQTGFYREREAVVWTAGTVVYSDSRSYGNLMGLRRTQRPVHTGDAQDRQNWEDILASRSPYDGELHREGDNAWVRKVLLPRPGMDTGTAGPLEFALWAYMRFDPNEPERSAAARAASLIRGLWIDPREIARSEGRDPDQSSGMNLRRIRGKTIFEVVRSGDRAALAAFTSAKSDLQARDTDGLTPLLAALRAGQTDVAADLLAAGADPSTADADGITPLMLSMDRIHADLPARLMEVGGDVRAVSGDGRSALHYALWNGRDELAAALVRQDVPLTADSQGWTPFLLAVRHGAETTYRLLLDRPLDPTQRTAHGWTALHLAARFAPVWLAALLARPGTPLAARTDAGVTALSLAAQYADALAVKTLLQAGADVSASDQAGWTPLMLALRYGETSTAETLLETAGSAVGVNQDGWTALHFAARYRPALVPRVAADPSLPAGAVNAVTTAGYSPLHLSAVSRSTEAIRWLLVNGADTTRKNRDGKTASDLAADNGDLSLARMMGASGGLGSPPATPVGATASSAP